jgi:hypothetical protein
MWTLGLATEIDPMKNKSLRNSRSGRKFRVFADLVKRARMNIKILDSGLGECLPDLFPFHQGRGPF